MKSTVFVTFWIIIYKLVYSVTSFVKRNVVLEKSKTLLKLIGRTFLYLTKIAVASWRTVRLKRICTFSDVCISVVVKTRCLPDWTPDINAWAALEYNIRSNVNCSPFIKAILPIFLIQDVVLTKQGSTSLYSPQLNFCALMLRFNIFSSQTFTYYDDIRTVNNCWTVWSYLAGP
jgi:hypothetical protein